MPSPFSATVLESFRVHDPGGHRLVGLIQRPRALQAGGHPAVVLLPGALGAGRTMARRPGAAMLAAEGVVTASFNARGRTSGKLADPRSQGRCDYNGFADQDGLAAVIQTVARLPYVDASRIGLYAVSFGLVVAAGCLARHPELPIAWLIDEEGPSDAAAALLRGWSLVPALDPGMGPRALALFGHDLPSTSQAAQRFWAQREPLRFIGSFRGRYYRLQASWDHVQPPRAPEQVQPYHLPPRWWQGKHAVDLTNQAVKSGVPWVRLNPPEQGNPVNATFTPEHPPRFLPGSMADHPRLWIEAVREMVAMGPVEGA